MQHKSESELRQKLIELGIWDKIHSDQLLEKIQRTSPAAIAPGGVSQIVSYWDEHLRYLCTIHRVITADGQIIHEDVKDAFLNGVRYLAVKD